MPAKAFSSALHDMRLLSLHRYLHISWAIEIYCRALVFLEYISVSAVTAAGGFAFTASHLEKPQVTKGSCPAIRCLAQARHAITKALLRGPPAQRLRSASGKGASRSGSKAKATATATARSTASRASPLLQGSAYGFRFSPLNRPSVSSPAAFDLDAPPPREAEWRFCAVGNPAWMPG